MRHLGFFILLFIIIIFVERATPEKKKMKKKKKKKRCQENGSEKEDDRSIRLLCSRVDHISAGNVMVKLTCAPLFFYSLCVIASSSVFLFLSFTCLIVFFSFFSGRLICYPSNCFRTRTNQRCHRNALDCSCYPAAIKENQNNRSWPAFRTTSSRRIWNLENVFLFLLLFPFG